MLLDVKKILLVDNDPHHLDDIKFFLKMDGISPIVAIHDYSKVIPTLAKGDIPRLILLSLSLSHLSEGMELLFDVHKQYPDLPVIVITSHDDPMTIVKCMKSGAVDYLVKPVEREVLFQRVSNELQELQSPVHGGQAALGASQMSREILNQPDAFSHIVTSNSRMIRLFRYLESIAPSSEPVLITGETGVGKELFAQALHNLSHPEAPLIIENVAGLDDTIFSDTLFGHVKGAFTGADAPRQGLAARAGTGTLVLDEIGDLSPQSQIKLLRMIQQRCFAPLGADRPIPFLGRIVVSTHRDLAQAVKEGSFREDLLFRLKTHTVEIPPLRERYDDFAELAKHFAQEASELLGRNIPSPKEKLTEMMRVYSFPGNIRELRALMMDAASLYRGSGPLPYEPFVRLIRDRDSADDAPVVDYYSEMSPHMMPWQVVIPPDARFPTLKEALKQVEISIIAQALDRTDGNKSQAATLLGLSRQAFYKRTRSLPPDQ